MSTVSFPAQLHYGIVFLKMLSFDLNSSKLELIDTIYPQVLSKEISCLLLIFYFFFFCNPISHSGYLALPVVNSNLKKEKRKKKQLLTEHKKIIHQQWNTLHIINNFKEISKNCLITTFEQYISEISYQQQEPLAASKQNQYQHSRANKQKRINKIFYC